MRSASKAVASLKWVFPKGLSNKLQDRAGRVLADYFNGDPQMTLVDWKGIPFTSPLPKHVLHALRDVGFVGKLRITLEVLNG